MSTAQQRPRASLPGRAIKPFPSRNPSYRALSIIDSYGPDLHLTIPQLQEHILPGVRSAPLLDREEAFQQSRRDVLRDSYGQEFDIDEAYGSAEPDLYDDDLEEIINLDQYEASPIVSLPSRTSSQRPIAQQKIEAQIRIVKMTSDLPLEPHSEDYDPYKAESPPKRNPARIAIRAVVAHTEPLFMVYNQTSPSPEVPPKDAPKLESLLAATRSPSQLSGLSTPRSASMDKALPSVPRMSKKLLASPMDNKNEVTKASVQQKMKNLRGFRSNSNKNVETEKDTRKDSMIQSDRGSASVTSSPPMKRWPAITEGQWMTPRLSIEDEASISVPTGIVRTTKPVGLKLSKSNGSTMPVEANPAPVVPSSRPLPSNSPVQEPLDVSEAMEVVDKPTVWAPSLSASHVASQSPLAVTTDTANNNPIENTFRQLQRQDQPIVAAITQELSPINHESTVTTETPDMKRIKNLVRRRPVGSTASASSSVASKEKVRPRHSSSPTKAAQAQLTNAPLSNTDTQLHHSQQASSKSNTVDLSPKASDRSLEAFPLLESQVSSTTTILVSQPGNVRPTTPPVLRSPTPLSQLEESPSKYGLRKKSEHNLRAVAEERQSQAFGQGANGVLRFLTAQKTLQSSLLHDVPRSPILHADIVIQNEAKRTSLYHATLLDFIKERPRDSNAPQLSTTQLHCYNDHSTKWHKSDGTDHPVNCAMCDVESGARWSCSSCALRVCKDCHEVIGTRTENTEFNILLRAAREETERMRVEVSSRRARSDTQRTATPFRPGSPVVYPPSDADAPYANHSAAVSTQSLPGIVRPRSRQGPSSGQMYPPSAYRHNHIPYGRPPGLRHRTSNGSLSAQDAPPTPRIPDRYLGEQQSKISMPRGSRGSDLDTRGRMGPSAEYGRAHSASRQGSPMRGPSDGRGASRSRPSNGLEIDHTADLRRPTQGPYAAIPRAAGARTPGSLR